jgi:hypothetical protein
MGVILRGEVIRMSKPPLDPEPDPAPEPEPDPPIPPVHVRG